MPLSELNKQAIIESRLAQGEELDPYRFPELYTHSPAFLYKFTPVAKAPALPEIVFVPTYKAKRLDRVGVLASWNGLWEAAQYRREVF